MFEFVRNSQAVLVLMVQESHFENSWRRSCGKPGCWKDWKAGGEGDNRGGDGWVGITDLMDTSLSKLRVGDGHGSLVCWGHKDSDSTE